MEKETLEEAAESEAFEFKVDYKPFETDLNYREYAEYGFVKGFIKGANWQSERMYSEEDMIEFAKWVFLEVGSNTGKSRTNKELFNEWFEQFKKK